MTAQLELSGLVVTYGRVPAVQGIDLHVAAGEVVTVVGRNGAGKTTTLSAIAGLRRPNAGEIRFDGTSVGGLVPEQVVRRGISLVPEGRQIFATLSVEENLRLGATARTDRDAVGADLEAAFERFPVLHRSAANPAGELSGGEQQQLAIARALLARPSLLLLDEPSLGLAPKMVDLVFDTLAELRSESVSILLVEQNARRAIRFADRSYVLENGRVRLSGTRAELVDNPEVERAYMGADA